MGGGSGRKLKLCLAASGGGHVRQLLDLEPVWRDQDYFIVTEDTALGRSLAAHHPVRFVAHYALGQARLGRVGTMLKGAFLNLRQSLRIIREERPDVVITTGAGAVFWTTLFARFRGARVVLIDSFARFEAPSKFARAVKPFATRTIVQSAALKAYWPDAELFDPLKILDEPSGPKQPLLFATVGATLQFPRLTESVLELKRSGRLPERVLLQAGEGGVPEDIPPGAEAVETLPFERVKMLLHDAAFVVCHGGTGSLITALRAGCRTIAMPRRFALGEHYDDHQEEITAAFKARGLIEIAGDAGELADAIERLRGAPAKVATTDPEELTAFLRTLLSAWAPLPD